MRGGWKERIDKTNGNVGENIIDGDNQDLRISQTCQTESKVPSHLIWKTWDWGTTISQVTKSCTLCKLVGRCFD